MPTQYFLKNKSARMASFGTFANLLSTNSYVDVDTIEVSAYRTKNFRLTATTNNLLVNVLGSIDGGVTFDQTVAADVSVTTGAGANVSYTTPLTHIKLQVKAAVGGSQGTLATKFFLSWL